MLSKFIQVNEVYSKSTIAYGPFERTGWYAVDSIESPLCVHLLKKVSLIETYGYNLYVLGSVFEHWTSWDVDMKLTGNPKTPEDWERVYEVLWYISWAGFSTGIYIDCNFARSIDLCRINCGGMDKWDGQYEYEDAYEITNYYSKNGGGGVMENYTETPSGLWRRNIRYPFDKNIRRYNEEGFVYHKPVLINDLI